MQALERLAGLLENERASITLMEKGTTDAVPRQANFRLFAAMNPATDAGPPPRTCTFYALLHPACVLGKEKAKALTRDAVTQASESCRLR